MTSKSICHDVERVASVDHKFAQPQASGAQIYTYLAFTRPPASITDSIVHMLLDS